MAELLNWVLFGALAGWITALMMRSDAESHEAIKQLTIGGIGAVIGGTAYTLFMAGQGISNFRSGGLMITIVCSIAAAIVIENLSNRLNVSKRR